MTVATRAANTGPAPQRILSLDRLAALSSEALAGLYARGRVPDDLTLLAGRPQGRMLAVRGLGRGPIGRWLRKAAAAAKFPWQGKSFFVGSSREGRGINRIRLIGRFEWFPFATRVEPSLLDGQPSVILDYAQSGNPWPIARIHDELREVAPGLYLGPALIRHRGGATLVMWFAVDFHTPA